MITRIKRGWRRLREHFWLSLLVDSLLILIAFLLIHGWQTRDLPVDQPAPDTRLAQLDGSGIRSAFGEGEAGVVYFFAPWCFYCKTSIGNLDQLVESGRISWATAVALDYGDAAEVQEFVDGTEITLPVLMGNNQTAADWSVRAFPTYYVIDAEGRISSRSVGYSTMLGMWLRAWLAR